MIFQSARNLWEQRLRRDPYATAYSTSALDSFNDFVLVTGCFDLLHRGHVELMKIAHQLRGCVVVGINSDESVRRLKGPERPLIPQADRVYMIDSLACVQAVFVFEEDTVVETLRTLNPPWWVKGGDWTTDTMNQDELATAAELGVRLLIIPRIGDYSTTSLHKKLQAQ